MNLKFTLFFAEFCVSLQKILDNMAKTYAIFSVSDYKGGELHAMPNLTYKRFIDQLTELFDNVDFDEISERRERKIKKVLDGDNDVDTASDIEYVKGKLTEAMKDRDFYSTYAGGGGGFCGKMYEVEDGRMTIVNVGNYLDDIAKVLLKHLK